MPDKQNIDMNWMQLQDGFTVAEGANNISGDISKERFAQLVCDVNLAGTVIVSELYSRIIKKNGTDTYIMQAVPGSLSGSAVWRIQKIDVDGSRFWADGDTNFDNVASGYLSHSYTL